MVVYIVGAGPGDPKLITIKANELIRKADVILYDKLISIDLLSHSKKDCIKVYVGKKSEGSSQLQDEINEELYKYGKMYDVVVRLKGGDPYIFGRGAEEAMYLYERNIPFEIIPGISSTVSCPMYAGIPLSYRESNSSFAFLTGHEAENKSFSINWERLPDTLVIVMGVKNRDLIAKNLINAGFDPKTPVAIIKNGTTLLQETTICDLGSLGTTPAEPPSVIFVGKNVLLRDKLDFFQKKLSLIKNKDIFVSRESGNELEIMKKNGANVYAYSLIEIVNIDFKVPNLSDYDVIVLTSATGVDRLESISLPKDKEYYTIGPKTEEKLIEKGIYPRIPEKYNSKELTKFMISEFKDRKKILTLRSQEALGYLEEKLSEFHEVTRVNTYKLKLKDEVPEKTEFDVAFITSSSNAKAFKKMGINAEIVVSIGPETSNELRKNGINPLIEADNHTLSGMLESLLDYLFRGGNFGKDKRS
ncbi:MAG: Uroporphyrinogen-III C-methyltransferase [Candidatus Methanofastidiosum methylothiophilum]|uniref:uroporphyrinogen-III C-methyltransferase n=1 Tax=Candidatus Methanofastidiosum methylothiophilum TaxID=1705564 RepID=A0A150JJG6_9EURY|nr:MAG: Uroporphyrinogen-III C-methyltransferase [Candidatus Methanofastidiosum methylthiophilus]MBP6932207.1 uroporphyrinogen-III C-methyltransferase [Methanofastidiosum sp.]OQC52587.1 MAG: Uroporphyrinogen-III C-methyltransferase [Euryarchaeota archaeon ADurb.Bin023]KYC57377.1 MAG: Uroporphyrinogen-III C-methyltransferase [Candidatus Methanofastidiosum methylthiophilus]KYC58163.1 MAG: Uroporphyrinogen-III C-methyltransferase [Candidatus Methanofastidiosum methylthiophilus]